MNFSWIIGLVALSDPLQAVAMRSLIQSDALFLDHFGVRVDKRLDHPSLLFMVCERTGEVDSILELRLAQRCLHRRRVGWTYFVVMLSVKSSMKSLTLLECLLGGLPCGFRRVGCAM